MKVKLKVYGEIGKFMGNLIFSFMKIKNFKEFPNNWKVIVNNLNNGYGDVVLQYNKSPKEIYQIKLLFHATMYIVDDIHSVNEKFADQVHYILADYIRYFVLDDILIGTKAEFITE